MSSPRVGTPFGSLLLGCLLAATAATPALAAEPTGWAQEAISVAGVSRAHLGDVELRRARDGRLVAVAVRASADESSAGLTILERSAGADGAWRLLAVTRHADIRPSLALAAGGAVHIAWVREGAGIRYTTNRTGAWRVEVIPGGSGGEAPSLALTNGGTPSVAFSVPLSRTSHAVRIASKTVRGWTVRTVATGDVGQPSLAIDQWSKRHIVYVRRSGSAPGLYYATDRSGTWRTTRLTSAPDVEWPRIVLDLARHVHVAYGRESAAAARVLHVTDVTGTWRTTTASGPEGGSSPEITLDVAGRPVIGYVAGRSFSAAPVWIAAWTGSGWSRTPATADPIAGRTGVAFDGPALHVVARRPIADPGGSGELVHAVRVP